MPADAVPPFNSYHASGSDYAANDPFSVGSPVYDPFLGDRLKTGSDVFRPEAYPEPQKRQQPRPRLSDAVVAVVLPWLVFFLVTCLFLFAYHEMPMVVWILIALCGGLAFLFLILGACARHGSFLAIGFLCLTSVVVGVVVGLWLHVEYLERYWQLDSGQEYSNVLPTGDPKATHDAAVIHFTPGTFVDDRRTIGFVAGGGILCLAPVVAPFRSEAAVTYWAVGEDCCEMRCNFDCGAARDSPSGAAGGDTAAALTAVAERRSSLYDKAIAQAVSVYGINSTANAQLVSFVNDPKAVISDIWDETLTIALIAMIMDLCMCVVAGLVISRILTAAAAQRPYDRDK